MRMNWRRALKSVWGIDGALQQLPGEYDLNFLVVGDRNLVLKVMRQDCDPAFVDMQCRALDHIHRNESGVPAPQVQKTLSGELFTTLNDETGAPRIAWLLEKIEGCTFAQFAPKSLELLSQIGTATAKIGNALGGFAHPGLARDFKWNLVQSTWIENHLDIIIGATRKNMLVQIIHAFRKIQPLLDRLPFVAIHNDINDHNIMVSGSLTSAPHITGIIDMGDMCAGPRICDLAIAAAYGVLGQPDAETALAAMISGYHAAFPLSSDEVDLIWPLLRMRLAVSVVNSTSMAIDNPDDPYVVVSQNAAWAFLENNTVNIKQINARLRAACGLPVLDRAPRVAQWIRSNRGKFAAVLGCNLNDAPMGSLAVEACSAPQNPFSITAEEAARVGEIHGENGQVWLGYYREPRLVYTDEAFSKGPWKASDRRGVHMGVDIFAPSGAPVYAPLEGEVVCAGYRAGNLDYGGLIILRHKSPAGEDFHTLYGHLTRASAENAGIGQRINGGAQFAALGAVDENGGWNPHLHFQMAYSDAGMEDDWPGAVSADDLDFWTQMCPNPAALLNLPDERLLFTPTSQDAVLRDRRASFGQNLKLTYDTPVMLLRGWKHHLFDEWGRPYLDAYNNVPHVGHAHPRIQAVAAEQLRRLNSNTRYLHPAQTAFAKKILSKMPEALSVCFFVNSGSEANELALRLSRAHTGGKDIITPNHGYHGNTTGAMDISAYKFNAKGGAGQPDWVQLVEVADDYRGSFRRDDPERGEKYAALVNTALTNIQTRGGKLAGYIAETFPSVGGQIIPPKGYLSEVYQRIRVAGGVCIADEVQTGLGRLGDYYFGFEQQQVIPDIVILGKPVGNGHPIGVVVTTREIADSFANGPEYFSTFGGSTLSCLMGKEVLDIVDDENLMENARVMGNRLLTGLTRLGEKYEIVGDARGFGLFVGLELVHDKASRAPGAQIASYLKNRLRQQRILIGSEGPHDNILKIRPPLTIEAPDVDMILAVLEQALAEASFLNDLTK